MAQRLLNISLINSTNLYIQNSSQEFILESAKIILERNNLNFDNDYFNQIKGTAIDTVFAPTYAILTMKYFELSFHDLFRNKFGEDLGNLIFENWSCFLDDCETLLEENKINPDDLLIKLNQPINSVDNGIQ